MSVILGENKTKKVEVSVSGMTCSNCAKLLEQSIKNVDGVRAAAVNFSTETALIEYDPAKITLKKIFETIEKSGYRPRMNKLILKIKGMSCASCVKRVENTISSVPNVVNVVANLLSESVTIEYINNINIKTIKEKVTMAGYSLEGILEEDSLTNGTKNNIEEKRELIITFVLSLTIMILSMNHQFMSLHYSGYILWLLATPVQFWFGLRFYKGMWNSLKHLSADMNTLVAIGTSAAYLYSVMVVIMPWLFSNTKANIGIYFDTSAMIITIVLLGRYIESRARRLTSKAIEKLIRLTPKKTTVIRDGQEVDVPLEEVRIGDTIVIRPGDIIPVDGIVKDGSTTVDESMITGESFPSDKYIGDKVIAGTINLTGKVLINAIDVGEKTTLARIIKLVKEAQSSKAPLQRIADRVANYFVPVVISIAVVTFTVWYILGPSPSINYAALNFVAVLIIACPCAMGLATPAAIVVGIGRGADYGILFKNGESLEKLHKVKRLVFDKTGTITEGKFIVKDIISVDSKNEDEILGLVASGENYTQHPLASAVVREAKTRGIKLQEVSKLKIVPGGVEYEINGNRILVGNQRLFMESNIGLIGLSPEIDFLKQEGKTLMFVASNGVLLGLITFIDIIREDVKSIVQSLHNIGIEVIMVTGDNLHAAKSVANAVGIKKVIAEVKPEQKSEIIKDLKKDVMVAMVGDGINDAPALAQADVGIAIGTGTDIALETSDINLIGNNLKKVLMAFRLSQKTVKVIKQNLFWAFIYNIILIPIAGGILYIIFYNAGVPEGLHFILGEYGFLNPILAAIAMAMSSITVVLNSLRLKNYKIEY